ncbi:MAG TPA: HipA domain-containing protein [Jatrophihabitantaceae bacterium]|jgi:serine/threonine-protein kinase HipA|nr:HipA domain-containing protein [Jatrophihabitantaceae bacterium]
MAGREPLSVWLYGTRVADLTETPNGQVDLTWTGDAYDRWGSGSRVMSHLLPIALPRDRPHPRRATAFVEGLLPEGNARTNYAMDVGVRSEDVYGLISSYGRDTAGALIFQPVDEPEPIRVGNYRAIAEAEVGQRLRAADSHAPTDQSKRGVESISLTGMQPKIGLHRIDGVWQACQSGAPSTWIVKLAHPKDSEAEDVIDTEVLCIDLARAVGLSTIHAEIHDFDGVRAIAVRRYDRQETPDGLLRIHQEDMAQALGINTENPSAKFQRGNNMPALKLIAEVLRAGGSEPDDLVRLVTFSHLIGNTDAHAKNISVLRHPDGTATVAPAYDVAMHLHHGRKVPLSAMDINGKFRMNDITIDDVVAEGVSWGLPPARVHRLVTGTAAALTEAIDAIDPDDYPGVPSKAWRTVSTRIDKARRDLDDGLIDIDPPAQRFPATGDIPVVGHTRGRAPVQPHIRRRGPRRP